MEITQKTTDSTMNISISGQLNTNTSPQLEAVINSIPESITELIIDLHDLVYVASSGLRMFLTAQKKMAKQGSMVIQNVVPGVYDIFKTTGFTEILTIEPLAREISIDGCKLIGKGMCGECWRIDDETVLKLYNANTPKSMVDKEKAKARSAFILGVPTAISYDMVTCQNRHGVLFEMLNAQTLSHVCVNDLEHLDDYAVKFAKLGRIVHSTKGDPALLPRAIETYRELEPLCTWFTKDEHKRLKDLIEGLPDADTCIHGDFHIGNVMIQNGELMFIDMGDFAIGSPYQDIAHVYNICALAECEVVGKAVTGLEYPERLRFWNTFIRAYFETDDESKLAEKFELIEKFNCMRQIFYIYHFEGTREINLAMVRRLLAKYA